MQALVCYCVCLCVFSWYKAYDVVLGAWHRTQSPGTSAVELQKAEQPISSVNRQVTVMMWHVAMVPIMFHARQQHEYTSL